MRVAILHDYLNQYGGAERVLEVFLGMFPKADLFTLLYDPARTRGVFEGRVTGTSRIDVPFVRHHHRAFIPLMPLAAATVRPSQPTAARAGNFYDLVLSSSAGYAKGFAIAGATHISYCHSPLRYAWEFDYLKNIPFSPWPLREAVLKPLARALQRWDRRAADRVDVFLANSRFIADKIRAYYDREAEIIYPPVDTEFWKPLTRGELKTNQRTTKNYYLMAGRLLSYKRFDLGIRAFNKLGRALMVIGAGPEEVKLKKLAVAPLITFVKNISDEELRARYRGAKALIFPQIEDFGLVAAEAQACGTPVIAYRKGGGVEIVEDGTTGIQFHSQTPEAIVDAVRRFENLQFDPYVIAARARRFSKSAFVENINRVIHRAVSASINIAHQ
ncbi:MAG: glycosyltransferase [Candidatus Brennerbacteria bacterium]|nr:glycosyltransferase [Candidatus Brennerbacteria bacterium]